MPWTHDRIPALALCALVAACQSADPPGLNYTDYRAAFTQAISSYFQRCGVVAADRAGLLGDTPLLAVAPELQATIDAEVKIGRVKLSTDCFASLATAACDISEAYAAIQGCTIDGKQYIPQVPLGRLCRLQGECIGGYCDLGAVRKPCGTGVCTAYLRVGTACGTGLGRCDPDQATCWEGTCRVRGAPGSSCLSDSDCDAQSTCKSVGQDGARLCAARQKDLPPGSSCDAGQIPDGCGSGARCVAPEPGLSPVCIRGKADGSACYSTQECQGTSVCAGADAAAKKPGACQRQGQLGDSCAATGSVCQLTVYCDAQKKTCQPAAVLGAACVRDPQAPGQACLSGQCVTDGGGAVCRDRQPDGSPCQSPGDCLSGVCSTGGLCSSVCAPLR